MPMRGELVSPALRARRSGGDDDVSWQDLGEAFNSLDAGVVIFSAIGLFATLFLAALDPSTASEIAAAIGQVF